MEKTENTFTLQQIKEAHSKVKSGADFPEYIRELKQLGVQFYETKVNNGVTRYHGTKDYQASSPQKYNELLIAVLCDKPKSLHSLKIHQQGETDYPTFCRHCAETGIEKWLVNLKEMTCTYYDKAGNKMLVEQVPG